MEKPLQSDMQELVGLKVSFTGLIADADYQQGKLLPRGGYSAQPAASYYKQKKYALTTSGLFFFKAGRQITTMPVTRELLDLQTQPSPVWIISSVPMCRHG